jgi:hypothetical protein
MRVDCGNPLGPGPRGPNIAPGFPNKEGPVPAPPKAYPKINKL